MTKKPISDSMTCPYCLSQDFVRRGTRKKKMESVQLYLCKSCRKTFTPNITKGKHYPLAIVLDAVSIYNLGYNLEQTCRIVNKRKWEMRNGKLDKEMGSEKRDIPLQNVSLPNPASHVTPLTSYQLQPSTLATWVSEFEPLCRYFKMRPYVTKKYRPGEVIISATLAHRQLYRYRYHRAKCELLLEDEYKHRRFHPLREFLEMVPAECPHQYFQEGLRASEAPLTFNKTAMIVQAKQNFANRLCEFVLQSVKERKDRHEALQKFMLANDSVTVATEVPVYLTRDDIEHMKTQLGFEIFSRSVIPSASEGSLADASSTADKLRDSSPASRRARNDNKGKGKNPLPTLPDVESKVPAENCSDVVLPKLITGHIDILQIRNGQIHILDYKPKAEKERPIEQLTLYAMALSRLTGLRLFEFKCAWFDEKDYFEFYPLHVLHKPKRARRRRKIETNEGVYQINRNENKIERLRPEKISVKVGGNRE